jgi:hypothetical protein
MQNHLTYKDIDSKTIRVAHLDKSIVLFGILYFFFKKKTKHKYLNT